MEPYFCIWRQLQELCLCQILERKAILTVEEWILNLTVGKDGKINYVDQRQWFGQAYKRLEAICGASVS